MTEEPATQESDARGHKKYHIKLVHLIAIVTIIIASLIIIIFFLTNQQKAYTSVGNGWSYINGYGVTLTGGKLQVDFLGIESCEFCAVERFAFLEALSNFGNWTYYNKTVTMSDLPSNNLTFSSEPQNDALFYKAYEGDWTINFLSSHLSYQSSLIDFITRESANNAGLALQQITPYEQNYLTRSDPTGSVPFSIIGGNFFEIGAGTSLVATYGPILFWQNGSGLLPSSIVNEYNQQGSEINIGINTEADYITALICYDINNSAPICTSLAIESLESSIKSKI